MYCSFNDGRSIYNSKKIWAIRQFFVVETLTFTTKLALEQHMNMRFLQQQGTYDRFVKKRLESILLLNIKPYVKNH